MNNARILKQINNILDKFDIKTGLERAALTWELVKLTDETKKDAFFQGLRKHKGKKNAV